jgi:hypothetical protein
MEPTNLNKELLLKIMERSYKLSWINYEESIRGCLPTIAYELKLQLEAELSAMVEVALDEVIASYEEWLKAYEEYVTRLTAIIEDLPDTLYYARINEVQKLISTLRMFRSRDALLDKINALQLGILNAYHDRSLADFLDLPANAEAFLERLFMEPFIEAWDKDLSQVIFREPGSIKSEERVFLNAGTVSYSDLFLTLAMVHTDEKISTKNENEG